MQASGKEYELIKRKLTKAVIAVVLLFASTTFYYSPAPVITSLQCHTANLWYEARGESPEGMKAISAVVINRKNSGKFGSSDCQVIFQKHQFSWTKQQSFKDIQKALNGDTSDLTAKDRRVYQQVQQIASKAVLEGSSGTVPKATMWYHATYAKPRWSEKFKRVKKIGKHVFYVR